MARALGIALDTKGFDKMIEAIDEEHRKPALKEAMYTGVGIVRAKIREKYHAAKPQNQVEIPHNGLIAQLVRARA